MAATTQYFRIRNLIEFKDSLGNEIIDPLNNPKLPSADWSTTNPMIFFKNLTAPASPSAEALDDFQAITYNLILIVNHAAVPLEAATDWGSGFGYSRIPPGDVLVADYANMSTNRLTVRGVGGTALYSVLAGN